VESDGAEIGGEEIKYFVEEETTSTPPPPPPSEPATVTATAAPAPAVADEDEEEIGAIAGKEEAGCGFAVEVPQPMMDERGTDSQLMLCRFHKIMRGSDSHHHQ